MEKDKYLVVGYKMCDPYYDGNTDKLIEVGFPFYKEFEHLSDARIYVDNLPETSVNVRIYELFERYEEEKEVKTELDSFFEEFNKMT